MTRIRLASRNRDVVAVPPASDDRGKEELWIYARQARGRDVATQVPEYIAFMGVLQAGLALRLPLPFA